MKCPEILWTLVPFKSYYWLRHSLVDCSGKITQTLRMLISELVDLI
jgi:hypothetical protein